MYESFFNKNLKTLISCKQTWGKSPEFVSSLTKIRELLHTMLVCNLPTFTNFVHEIFRWRTVTVTNNPSS